MSLSISDLDSWITGQFQSLNIDVPCLYTRYISSLLSNKDAIAGTCNREANVEEVTNCLLDITDKSVTEVEDVVCTLCTKLKEYSQSWGSPQVCVLESPKRSKESYSEAFPKLSQKRSQSRPIGAWLQRVDGARMDVFGGLPIIIPDPAIISIKLGEDCIDDDSILDLESLKADLVDILEENVAEKRWDQFSVSTNRISDDSSEFDSSSTALLILDKFIDNDLISSDALRDWYRENDEQTFNCDQIDPDARSPGPYQGNIVHLRRNAVDYDCFQFLPDRQKSRFTFAQPKGASFFKSDFLYSFLDDLANAFPLKTMFTPLKDHGFTLHEDFSQQTELILPNRIRSAPETPTMFHPQLSPQCFNDKNPSASKVSPNASMNSKRLSFTSTEECNQEVCMINDEDVSMCSPTNMEIAQQMLYSDMAAADSYHAIDSAGDQSPCTNSTSHLKGVVLLNSEQQLPNWDSTDVLFSAETHFKPIHSPTGSTLEMKIDKPVGVDEELKLSGIADLCYDPEDVALKNQLEEERIWLANMDLVNDALQEPVGSVDEIWQRSGQGLYDCMKLDDYEVECLSFNGTRRNSGKANGSWQTSPEPVCGEALPSLGRDTIWGNSCATSSQICGVCDDYSAFAWGTETMIAPYSISYGEPAGRDFDAVQFADVDQENKAGTAWADKQPWEQPGNFQRSSEPTVKNSYSVVLNDGSKESVVWGSDYCDTGWKLGDVEDFKREWDALKQIGVSSSPVMDPNAFSTHSSNEQHRAATFEFNDQKDFWLDSPNTEEDSQVYKSMPLKKPCSFFLEGKCERKNCRFTHNLMSITCKFWLESACLKGTACPFAHHLGEPLEGGARKSTSSKAARKRLHSSMK